jgi:hypothetical protein
MQGNFGVQAEKEYGMIVNFGAHEARKNPANSIDQNHENDEIKATNDSNQ